MAGPQRPGRNNHIAASLVRYHRPARNSESTVEIGSDPMTVRAILSAKGGNVITIEPNANVEQAAKILAERRIGALVVTGPEQRVVGIVSERDIVAILAARGMHALDVPLTAVMTRKV